MEAAKDAYSIFYDTNMPVMATQQSLVEILILLKEVA